MRRFRVVDTDGVERGEGVEFDDGWVAVDGFLGDLCRGFTYQDLPLLLEVIASQRLPFKVEWIDEPEAS